jgi:hypothetical protein
MKKYINQFWEWYERKLHLNIGIAAILFSWQIVHLIWLLGDVVMRRAFGVGFFELEGFLEVLVVVIDYTEIPAIISVSLIYINTLRKQFDAKSFWFLLLLNSQWFHLFWITDEFVVAAFSNHGETVLPIWAAWVAIGIDYLELPVMYDTIKKFFIVLKKKP